MPNAHTPITNLLKTGTLIIASDPGIKSKSYATSCSLWTVLVDTLNFWTASLSNLEEMLHQNKISSHSCPKAENLCYELDYKELKWLSIFNFFWQVLITFQMTVFQIRVCLQRSANRISLYALSSALCFPEKNLKPKGKMCYYWQKINFRIPDGSLQAFLLHGSPKALSINM